MNNNSRPTVAVLISTYNRCNMLMRSLDSLFKQDYPKELLSLWILDDASTDETAMRIPAYINKKKDVGWRNLNYIRSSHNLHIVAARHRLEELAIPENKYIAVMDDDVVIPQHAISLLSGFMERHHDVGIVGPRFMLYKNPDTGCHYPNFVNSWTCQYTYKDTTKTTECDWVINAFCLFRSKALKESGGLDPRFYTCHEEVDLSLRTKKLGYKVMFLHDVIAKHDIDFSIPKLDRQYYLYRNKFLVIKKNFTGIHKWVALFFLITISFPKALWNSIKLQENAFPNLKMIIRAFMDGILNRWGSSSLKTL